MRQIQIQPLRGMILSIVLLAASVPFAAQAQSGGKTDTALKTEAKTAADSEEVILTFEATVDETGLFFFQNDAIEYRKSFEYPDPTGVTVDGKPWEDLSKPFRLGFTPDYGKAAIVEKQGRGRIELSTTPSQIMLLLEDKESSSAPYKVSIAVKNQGNREPAPSLVMSKPKQTIHPVKFNERRSGHFVKIPGRIYPKEFDTRMKELEIDSKNKHHRSMLLQSSRTNPGSLTDEEKKEVLQWKDESNQFRMASLETTDGRELPVKDSIGFFVPAAPLDLSATHTTIEIEAVIDYMAEFVIRDNAITYNFYTNKVEGKFPSQVTVNGRPWNNLYVPFSLGVPVDPSSLANTCIETELYRYSIYPDSTGKANIKIDCYGFREEPVKIRLSIRRK